MSQIEPHQNWKVKVEDGNLVLWWCDEHGTPLADTHTWSPDTAEKIRDEITNALEEMGSE